MGKHSREIPGGRAVWNEETLWQAARHLEPRLVAIDSIPEFDQNCWFRRETPPTCRRVAEHARRIFEANLDYPVILAADGRLMDGGHRIARAWTGGATEILAVRFATNPPPDLVLANASGGSALAPAFEPPVPPASNLRDATAAREPRGTSNKNKQPEPGRKGLHSCDVPGGRAFWREETLWAAAAELPTALVAIDDIAEFDLNCWFTLRAQPTCRAVAKHARRIFGADLAYPVILSASGELMDGGHRIARAWIAGHRDVLAVRFMEDPEPDWIVHDGSAEATAAPMFDGAAEPWLD